MATKIKHKSLAVIYFNCSLWDLGSGTVTSECWKLSGNATRVIVRKYVRFTFKVGKQKKLIFNPFSEYDLNLALYKIEFEFTFSSNQDEKINIKTVIKPQNYVQKESYTFPLKGKALVYDAHDYCSHHRRFDYEFEPIKQLGITTNLMRYAYDFVLLDENNNQYVGDSGKPESGPV